MSNFALVVDTSSDLSEDLRKRFSVDAVLHGFVYYPDGSNDKLSLDYSDEDLDKYYGQMKDKRSMFKTATPAVGEVEQIFENFLKQGRDVVVITLSSGLSSTYETTLGIASELNKKYENKIYCVDSLHYSFSIAQLAKLANECREKGINAEETADIITEKKDNLHQMGSLDDMFFLVKTGRINNFKAFFGSLIGLNLMAEFSDTGMVEVIGKVKGKSSMINATIEYMKTTIENPEEQTIFVSHTDRADAAKVLAQRIEEEFHPKEIILKRAGLGCGCSMGPGLCAAYYFGKKVSKDLLEEKNLMNQIIAK